MAISLRQKKGQKMKLKIKIKPTIPTIPTRREGWNYNSYFQQKMSESKKNP
jgi:hypothetical protein